MLIVKYTFTYLLYFRIIIRIKNSLLLETPIKEIKIPKELFNMLKSSVAPQRTNPTFYKWN